MARQEFGPGSDKPSGCCLSEVFRLFGALALSLRISTGGNEERTNTVATTEGPVGALGLEVGSGLPQGSREFRVELLRRLELLEREVRALLESGDSRSLAESVQSLRTLEVQLRAQLAADLDSTEWVKTRTEILVVWRRHRRAFEQLATDLRHRYEVRPGRRNRGPRW